MERMKVGDICHAEIGAKIGAGTGAECAVVSVGAANILVVEKTVFGE